MKIKGTPNELVRNSRNHRPLFRFDENGIADLAGRRIDYKTMQRIKNKFPEVKEAKVEVIADVNPLKCPHCDKIAKNAGGLASHIRAKHI